MVFSLILLRSLRVYILNNYSFQSRWIMALGIFTSPLRASVHFCSHYSPRFQRKIVNCQLYANNSQLYVAFKTNDAASIKNRIESGVGDICRCMNRHDLELNEHKTEVVLISWKCRDGLSVDYVNIGIERIHLSDKAIGLGAVLDKHTSFEHHIKHLYKSLVCQFRIFFSRSKST